MGVFVVGRRFLKWMTALWGSETCLAGQKRRRAAAVQKNPCFRFPAFRFFPFRFAPLASWRLNRSFPFSAFRLPQLARPPKRAKRTKAKVKTTEQLLFSFCAFCVFLRLSFFSLPVFLGGLGDLAVKPRSRFSLSQLYFPIGVHSAGDYILTMNRHIMSGLLAALGVVAAAHAEVAPLADNPYAAIVSRNAFGLVPIPTNPPVDPTPKVAPPKITPNGIMDIFGNLQALFKAPLPAKPGQPPHDESYVLSVGESQDDIEVTKIDKVAGTITFNNHGEVQELPLVTGVATSSAAPAGGGGAAAGGPMGGRPTGGGGPGNAGMPFPAAGGAANNYNPNPPQGNAGAAGNPMSGGGPSFGAAQNGAVPNSNSQSQEPLSPENQILLLEAQRMKAKAENNPMAAILPPLSPKLNKELYGNEAGPPGP